MNRGVELLFALAGLAMAEGNGWWTVTEEMPSVVWEWPGWSWDL
jgi:hypothetical protein